MTGTTDYTKGVDMLREQFNIPLICVTLGKDGSRAYYKNMIIVGAIFEKRYN